MNKLVKRLRSAGLGFGYMAMGLAPIVSADDTDIFFGGVATASVKPNVLFILDNSGSMAWETDETNGNDMARMQTMKNSFKSIMQNQTQINAGLMRLNPRNGGSRLIYPVTDVDRDYEQADINVLPLVSQGSDDATQTTNGTDTQSEKLIFGYKNLSQTTIESQVSHRYDDANQNGSGNTTTWWTDVSLDVRYGDAGIRFQGINIPYNNLNSPSIRIDQAYLTVEAFDNFNGPNTTGIYGDLTADANGFSPNFSTKNIDLRPTTNAYTDWVHDPAGWSKGRDYYSPDLSSIVQEIISTPNWQTGDALSLIFNNDAATNSRWFRSYDYSSSHAAKLSISYSTAGSAKAEYTTGLRFQGVNIPQGASITNAYIQFKPSASSIVSDDLKLRIQLKDDVNPQTFTHGSGELVVSGSLTAAQVEWQVPDWVEDNQVSTPNLAALVQSVVSQANWCGGNSLAFVLQATGSDRGIREAHSFEEGNTKQPRLVVEYDRNSVNANACRTVSFIRKITHDEDDAEQKSNNSVALRENTINMKSANKNGFRFTDIPLIKNASVEHAAIKFTATNGNSSSSTMTLEAEPSADSLRFVSTSNNISNRIAGSSGPQVIWNSTSSPGLEDWTSNNVYNTPDISTLLESSVSHTSWAPGQAISIIQTLSGSERKVYSHDSSTSKAAILEVRVKTSQLQAGYDSGLYKVRDHLISEVDSLYSSGGTPIAQTYLESARYYKGDGSYTSPITAGCQANYIVLLTDGSAWGNTVTNEIKTHIGKSSSFECKNDDADEECTEELASWLSTTDQSPQTGENTVTTFTVALSLDDVAARAYLDGLATDGGGKLVVAGSEDELTNAFNEILQGILETDTSFVVPAVSVNQYNQLTNREEIYYAVFRPELRPRWNGNLKQYKVSSSQANSGKLVGQNDVIAVDADTGFFADNVKSFWTDGEANDGPTVSAGGAAAEIPDPASRNLYSYVSNNELLSADANKFDHSNTNITESMLGAANSTERNNFLKWVRGYDVQDEDGDDDVTEIKGHLMGDPVHSSPITITYGGTEESPDITVFMATNEGFMHAINAADGQELFAFMPEELFGNIKTLYNNTRTDQHPYGLDGSITKWVVDANDDGVIDPSTTGDHAYIYFGMRRGGKHYYALDVTDRTQPKLMWHIDESAGNFGELGQTWSTPTRAKVKIGSNIKDVLVFGAGYDPDQDTSLVTTADTEGRGLFMVDAGNPDTSNVTPSLLWRAGPSAGNLVLTDFKYSIPGSISVGDVDGDGLTDHMYVADTGGQIWRFDIAHGSSADDLVTGGVIADLSTDDDADTAVNQRHNRKFYADLSVSTLIVDNTPFINIALGSGWRANPLEKTVLNRFYSLRQSLASQTTYTKLTESDLYNATDNLLESTDNDTLVRATNNFKDAEGWYIDLEITGEKVLSSALSVGGLLSFTTYEPNAATSSCKASVGTNRVYRVNAYNATPVFDYDDNGSRERSQILNVTGIAPSPTIIVRPDGSVWEIDSTQLLELDSNLIMGRTYWQEND